jgi:hypothetical protein
MKRGVHEKLRVQTAVSITKLGSKDGPNLLCHGSGYVGVHDIAGLNIEAVEGSNGQGNTNGFAGYDAGTGHGGWSSGQMPACDKHSLPSEVCHFDVKYHVTWDFLVTTRGSFPFWEDPECHADVFHFLSNCIGPKGIAVDAVQLVSLFNGLRYLDTIFVGPSEVMRLTFANKRYDSLPTSENIVGPPVMGWDSFKSLRSIHKVEPSFHWQHNCQPMVEHVLKARLLGWMRVWSFSAIAELRRLWSMMVSKR